MEEEWPIYTPVRHKIEGYKGWIDGVTRLKDCFTGHVESVWQYRIRMIDSEKRKIAPPEDLERITEGAQLPVFLVRNTAPAFIDVDGMLVVNPDYDGKKRFIEETDLHALGYQISAGKKEFSNGTL